MPTPAPSTPALEKIVKQLSVLLWVTLAFVPLSFIPVLLNPRYHLTGTFFLIALFSVLIGMGIWVVLVLNFSSWMNALLGHRTYTVFDRSSRTLILFLNIGLVLTGLAK